MCLSSDWRRPESANVVLCVVNPHIPARAGKSTLINVLSGLRPPTFGSAFVRGLDVSEDVTELQRIMGTCPQHDTLFDLLTPREHLELVCAFKGMFDPIAIADEVRERLDDVELSHVKDVPAGTFSGGMKRRLSVAMSAVGDPRIVFLDEPTTGLDPVVRRKIWAAIQRLKKGRLVILTSHSMEEADLLGDRIAILHEGKMRAIGTSLELKAKFGRGYEMTIACSPEIETQILPVLERHLLGGRIVASGSGNVKALVPGQTLRHFPALFQELRDMELDAKVDWGISNSTLEEVFLQLVASNRGLDEGLASSGADLTAFVDMDADMVAFALDSWRPLLEQQPATNSVAESMAVRVVGRGKKKGGGGGGGDGSLVGPQRIAARPSRQVHVCCAAPAPHPSRPPAPPVPRGVRPPVSGARHHRASFARSQAASYPWPPGGGRSSSLPRPSRKPADSAAWMQAPES